MDGTLDSDRLPVDLDLEEAVTALFWCVGVLLVLAGLGSWLLRGGWRTLVPAGLTVVGVVALLLPIVVRSAREAP